MPKIHYVGLKEDGETAFAELTNIPRWFKGDAHDVPDAVAQRLLKHPDVFSLTPEPTYALAQPPAPAPKPPRKPAITVDDLERDLGALGRGELLYADADTAVTAFREKFGELVTPEDEAEIREILKVDEHDGGGTATITEDLSADKDATATVTETQPAEVDTSGMTLAPGATVQAPPPAPAPTPAPTTGKAKRK